MTRSRSGEASSRSQRGGKSEVASEKIEREWGQRSMKTGELAGRRLAALSGKERQFL